MIEGPPGAFISSTTVTKQHLLFNTGLTTCNTLVIPDSPLPTSKDPSSVLSQLPWTLCHKQDIEKVRVYWKTILKLKNRSHDEHCVECPLCTEDSRSRDWARCFIIWQNAQHGLRSNRTQILLVWTKGSDRSVETLERDPSFNESYFLKMHIYWGPVVFRVKLNLGIKKGIRNKIKTMFLSWNKAIMDVYLSVALVTVIQGGK